MASLVLQPARGQVGGLETQLDPHGRQIKSAGLVEMESLVLKGMRPGINPINLEAPDGS
jgi:hypothetical protein